jgi:hypothetical protein
MLTAARIITDIFNDQGFKGPSQVRPLQAFQGPAGELAQVILGKAPGGGVGQALAHPVPQQQQAGVNVKKLQNRGQDLVDDLLEVQGMGGNGGDLIKQAKFPAVFPLLRCRLLQLLNGVCRAWFRHFWVSLAEV